MIRAEQVFAASKLREKFMRTFALVLFVGLLSLVTPVSAEEVAVIDKETGTAAVTDGKGNVAVADAEGNVVVEDKKGNVLVEDAEGNSVAMDKDGNVLAADIEDEDGDRIIVE